MRWTIGATVAAAALVLSGCATTSAPRVDRAPATTAQDFATQTLAAPDGRSVDLRILAPDRPRAVLLLSHGGGSRPEPLKPLAQRMAALGFAVIAPVHTDSLSLPPERRTTIPAALATRIADMKIAAGFAAQRYPGLPLAEMGHSYGALTALVGGGALAPMIAGRVPAVKAVVMLSSPGPIAPLTGAATAFAGVDAPTLLVTGTADTVPGIVTDPAQHLVYFDRLAPGDHTALVVAGATHDFVRGGQPGEAEVAAIIADFLRGRVLGDRAASRRFDAATTTPLVEVRRRR